MSGEFALCLTHDVDRPYKRLAHSLFYLATEPRRQHLRTLITGENTYWQFETVMRLEDDLGVRSAFYFLDQPPMGEVPTSEWDRRRLLEELGRYDVRKPEIEDVIRKLDREGWEVGLHGSLVSGRDGDRLDEEKRTIEELVGHPVAGGRQHHLALEVPDTWYDQADAGMVYDSSMGSSTGFGYGNGPGLACPTRDGPVVFPLTLMETALPDPGEEYDRARAVCDYLLDRAAAEGGVMTVLWHQRYFSTAEFPGYAQVYRYLVERALEMGAWVGPPGDLCAALGMDVPGVDEDRPPVTSASPSLG